MTNLRAQAERRLAHTPPLISCEPHEFQRLYHELQVHQAELEIQNMELQRTLHEIEAILLEQSSFCQALSHDISHPVLAIRLFLQELLAKPLAADEKDLLARIGWSADTLGELSRTLSAMCRETPPGGYDRLQQVALGPLLELSLNDHLPLTRQKGLSVHLVPTRVSVATVPALLRRIVSNMIANAIEHTASGGLVIGVRRSSHDALRIEVWDTGNGSTDSVSLPRAANAGARFGYAERFPATGEGLALAVAYRLAEKLGLRLDLRAAPGRGSVIMLTVPRRATA